MAQESRGFSPQDFLTGRLEAPDKWTGHFQERLKSSDGNRLIWTRIFYDNSREERPKGAVLALTVDSHNLMAMNVSYSWRGVSFESIGIGVASDLEEYKLVRRELMSPRTIYLLNTPANSGYWTIGGSIGPSSEADFQRIASHGFFPTSVFEKSQEPIDTVATAEAFLAQVDGYLQNPASFEPGISPSIQPVLVRR